jgi:hypothetical protein
MASSKPKPNTRVRDSRNGQFVPKSEAKRRPSTTETEVIRRKKG